jgi:hypothetical protein
MPSKLPAPAAGTAEQAAPNVPVDEVSAGVGAAVSPLVLLPSSLLQAAPTIARAAKAATIEARRFFMNRIRVLLP